MSLTQLKFKLKENSEGKMEFKFPKEQELTLFLKDILEDEVDDKYYLSKEQMEKILYPEKYNISTFRQRNLIKGDVCQTLQAAMSHGNTIPLIYQRGRGFNPGGIKKICPTISSNFWHQNNFLIEGDSLRKLTPKECFRLMGFLNDEINLEGISNTQRYKLAGNGWDINLVSKILKQMNLPDNLETFEMFAGYGGGSFALKKLGKKFECVGYSEIDKLASQCYEQNHKAEAVGDCREINPWSLDYFDLLMAGFPCQSFSIAGKGLGELDTRGTLFNEIIRVAEIKKPGYMLLENVKGLVSKKHKPTFDKILSELDRIGYDVFHKVCNTKLHGIPQNRDRIFFVCFRKDLECSPNLKKPNINNPCTEMPEKAVKGLLSAFEDVKNGDYITVVDDSHIHGNQHVKSGGNK